MEKDYYKKEELAKYKKLLLEKYNWIKPEGLCYIDIDCTIVYIGYSRKRIDMMADWLYKIDYDTEDNKYKILRELKETLPIKVGVLDN